MRNQRHHRKPAKEFKSITTKTWSKEDNPKLSLEAADFIVGKVLKIAQGQIQSKDLENKKWGYAVDKTLAYMLELASFGAMPHDIIDNSNFLHQSVEPKILGCDNLASFHVGVDTREVIVDHALPPPSPIKVPEKESPKRTWYARRAVKTTPRLRVDDPRHIVSETYDIKVEKKEEPNETVEYWRDYLGQQFRIRDIRAREDQIIAQELLLKEKRFKDLGKRDYTFDYQGNMILVKKPNLEKYLKKAIKRPKTHISVKQESSLGELGQHMHEQSNGSLTKEMSENMSTLNKTPQPENMFYTKERFVIRQRPPRKQENNIAPTYGVTMMVKEEIKEGGQFHTQPKYHGQIRTFNEINQKMHSMIAEKERELRMKYRTRGEEIPHSSPIKLKVDVDETTLEGGKTLTSTLDSKYPRARSMKKTSYFPKIFNQSSGKCLVNSMEKHPSYNSDMLKNTYFNWRKEILIKNRAKAGVPNLDINFEGEEQACFVPSVTNNRSYLDKEGLIVRRAKTTRPVREILDASKKPPSRVIRGNRGYNYEVEEHVGQGSRSKSSLNNSLISRKKSAGLHASLTGENRSMEITRTPSRLQPMPNYKLPPPPIGRVFGHGILFKKSNNKS